MRNTFLLLVLGALCLWLLNRAWECTAEFWNEWRGAFTRWRKGEPLRLSHLQKVQWAKERERIAKRKTELRSIYEREPQQIFNPVFHSEFRALGIHEEIRAEVISRCGYRCGACSRKIRRLSTLHVDHIKPRKLFPELIYVSKNLQVLCSKCNVHKSAYHGEDWKKVVAARRKRSSRKKRSERGNAEA